jgi:hypothetical protein
MVLAAHPSSNEMILVFNDDGDGDDYAYVWNGSSWGNGIELTIDGSASSYDINVAYEQSSGQALVIFGKADDDIFYYRIWNGSSWGSEQSKSFPSGVTVAAKFGATALASQSGTDFILLAFTTEKNEGVFMVWNGSAFLTAGQDNQIVTGLDKKYNISPIDVAFESQSGQGLGIVNNNKDEDGDGLIDCDDPDCLCCDAYIPTVTKD